MQPSCHQRSSSRQGANAVTFTRPVAPSDIDLICHHRQEMFREAGSPVSDLNAMAVPFRRWLMEINWPPHPAHPVDDRRGYILNLFVEPEYRGRGVARNLMEASDREFARRGLSYAILHATAMGRPLYERNGWQPTTEM